MPHWRDSAIFVMLAHSCRCHRLASVLSTAPLYSWSIGKIKSQFLPHTIFPCSILKFLKLSCALPLDDEVDTSIVLDRLLESKSECVCVAYDSSLRWSLHTGKGWRSGHDGATKFYNPEVQTLEKVKT